MKYLIDGRLISNKHTGISRYTIEIVKSYIDRYGYNNVIVITNFDIKDSFFQKIETKYKPYNLLHFFLYHIFLLKIEFDIYHSTYYANSFFKLKTKKYITTVHDLMYCCNFGFFSKYLIINKLGILYYNFIVRRSLKNSDLVISVSKTTQSDVKKFFNKNSEIVGEGINILNSDYIKLTRFHNLNKNDYFFYVGNLRRHKNVKFLINCYLQSNTNKKLVISGDYNKNEIAINANIIYLGYVTDVELSFLYGNCAAFIFPSLYEGFGLPILEALSYNAKVFSSNAGALSEFPSDIVYFFDPFEERSLIQLIESVDLITIDFKKIKEFLSLNSWDQILIKIHSLIKSLY